MDKADDRSTSRHQESGIAEGFDWMEHHKGATLALTFGAASLALGGMAEGRALEAATWDVAGARSLGARVWDMAGVRTLGAATGDTAGLDALEVRAMTTTDLPKVMNLVQRTEGLAFRPEETHAALERALKMNPGLSQVAVSSDKQVVGGVFVGETGLRGMVNHLAVDPDARGSGLATELVQRGLQELYNTTPVRRVYASVLADNETAMKFWSNLGRQATGRGVGEEVVTYIIDLDKQPWLNGRLGS